MVLFAPSFLVARESGPGESPPLHSFGCKADSWRCILLLASPMLSNLRFPSLLREPFRFKPLSYSTTLRLLDGEALYAPTVRAVVAPQYVSQHAPLDHQAPPYVPQPQRYDGNGNAPQPQYVPQYAPPLLDHQAPPYAPQAPLLPPPLDHQAPPYAPTVRRQWQCSAAVLLVIRLQDCLLCVLWRPFSRMRGAPAACRFLVVVRVQHIII
jgi:hypothetical protein